jgi:hypothetical protein
VSQSHTCSCQDIYRDNATHARGIYTLPVEQASSTDQLGSASSFGSRLLSVLSLGYLGAGAASTLRAQPQPRSSQFLYFGLPSNEQQDAVVDTLQRQGCAVLLGPPGTGKSQTIANVICHYLATGRRVLVTSKGEPATEVLRQKLPEGEIIEAACSPVASDCRRCSPRTAHHSHPLMAGIRELAISLGGGDSGSFRRLEGAVEHLADHVAGQPEDRLKAAAERLQTRFEGIQKQLDDMEAADARLAEKYFPPSTPGVSPLRGLQLHKDCLQLLGITRSDCSMVNLADAVVAVLTPNAQQPSSSSSAAAASSSSSTAPMGLLPPKAYFLEDLSVDPLGAPPAQHTLDQLSSLRRQCLPALRWVSGGRFHLGTGPY